MSSGSLLVFQSTLLQEERPFLGIFAPDCCQFQSTLLQEERRVKCKNTEAPTMISIHAPTRGATGCYFFVLKFPKISIHAPTRGATLPIIRDILFSAYFNPRSYKRSDSPSLFALSTIFHFNPRSYKRSDLYIIINIICCVISIHAPTRGATLSFLLLFWNPLYFNPRSYKRSDDIIGCSILTHINFNPRSYKRSDKLAYKLRMQNKISIHAPTRGAT